ncbi:M42 family metallopeptidase [Alicyclobacillus fodiniaquatilis]|jgi:endoglucanase|uniref:M42 family metallopeptidase n=1 Tax=Alicyclobacillus fodiniaquatilis TaxID=1661150 RepID=A0ABW4JHD5_9BACL
MEQLLRELTQLVGPCGFEHDVARYIRDRLQHKGAVRVDGVGNVIVSVKGAHAGPVLAISTHMDEVGFIVKKIEQNGLLRFEKLGGHDDRILLAQRVRIRTPHGSVPGVIGTISAHMQKADDVSRVRRYNQLYIDVGASGPKEVADMGITVGCPISWATSVERLGQHRLVGKSFDDRAGCAVLIQALEQLQPDTLYGTVHAVFSVQEEVGLRGARVAGRQLQPDVAIAIDTTAVSDTPEEMMDNTLALGAGPGIKVMDFSLIASVPVRDKLISLATEAGIPHQLEVFAGIGTDAGELSLAGAGVPTGVLSIPSRYAHSPVEVIDERDLQRTADLLIAFITSMRTAEEFAFI